MLSLFGKSFYSLSLRYFATLPKANKSALSELRKKTGFSISNCKKALEIFANNIEQAEEWLHQEAQREGWARITQLHKRPMSQGLLGLIHDGQCATIIEVNCETDFVAKNKKFQQLVSHLANACHSHLGATSTPSLTTMDTDDIGRVSTGNGTTISDMVASDVGVVGENMVARRVVHMRASPGATLSSYTHIAANDIAALDNCKFGKYATLVEYRAITSRGDSPLSDGAIGETEISLDDAARQVSQHIAGMNPAAIGEALDTSHVEELEDGDSRVNQVESNLDIMFRDVKGIEGNFTADEVNRKLEAAAEYDQSELIDRNVESEDLYEASDFDDGISVSEESETMLLRQKFLLDESITVADFLHENNMEVLNFVRMECGEIVAEK